MDVGSCPVANLVKHTGWSQERVLVTGHTGFKGSWLSLWLAELGASVSGIALDPISVPNLFDAANVHDTLAHDLRVDIRDRSVLQAAVARIDPTVVFHLAAQPLVRESYQSPLETFDTNVMGVANLLDVVRHQPSIKAVVVVTTDKVYRNLEDGHAYVETEPLGGHDPYSASKAAAEIIVDSYRSSFFGAQSDCRVASARAGNVIGGGDWSKDRLVPDCIRSFAAQETVSLRFPDSVRPWQHVLDPLSGYLTLAQALLQPDGDSAACAWNFGPDPTDVATVGDVAGRLAALWGDGAQVASLPDQDHPHEAGFLSLSSERAHRDLLWHPTWALNQSLRETVNWYQAWYATQSMRDVTIAQISAYMAVQ